MANSKNKVLPASHIGLDVITGRQRDSRKGSANINNQDVPFICPLHGAVRSANSEWKKKYEGKGIIDCIKAWLIRSEFERKLKAHGVQAHVGKAKLRTIEEESKESELLTRAELNILPVEKLRKLRCSMEREISRLNAEMMQQLEEEHVMATENDSLKKQSKELEDNVKTMTRPWINRYPNCDDLTRALLLS
eukprot:gene20569-22593_t